MAKKRMSAKKTAAQDGVKVIWDRYLKNRSDADRETLIEHYMYLADQAAERMSQRLPEHVDVQDLRQAAAMGLIKAIERFEPDRGYQFSTFSNLRINGAILDDLRRWDWAPRLVRSRVTKLDRIREELSSKLGRQPTTSEIAERMDISTEEFDELLRETQVKSMVSLDRKWNEEDDHETIQAEVLPDTKAVDPLAELSRAELKEIAIRGLSENQKMVVVMYYFENLSLKEIGTVLNLSESRVCQIHSQTLEFLKQKFISREISPV